MPSSGSNYYPKRADVTGYGKQTIDFAVRRYDVTKWPRHTLSGFLRRPLDKLPRAHSGYAYRPRGCNHIKPFRPLNRAPPERQTGAVDPDWSPERRDGRVLDIGMALTVCGHVITVGLLRDEECD